MRNKEDAVETIIEISNQAIQYISNLDDFIDEHIELLSDVGDTIGDVAGPVRAFGKLVAFINKRKFIIFLKNYAKAINEDISDYDREVLSDKLRNYLSKKRNYEFLSNSIQSAINSNSEYCTSILGYLNGKLISKELDVTYNDVIFMRALKDITDTELVSFLRLYNSVPNKGSSYQVRDIKKLSHIHYDFCEFAVIKLQSHLILTEQRNPRNMHPGMKIVNPFAIDELGELFYDLVKNSGVYDLIEREHQID